MCNAPESFARQGVRWLGVADLSETCLSKSGMCNGKFSLVCSGLLDTVTGYKPLISSQQSMSKRQSNNVVCRAPIGRQMPIKSSHNSVRLNIPPCCASLPYGIHQSIETSSQAGI